MHEVSLLLNVAEMVGKTIEGTDITHVDEVVLEIGDLTGVIPAFMIDGYSFISDEFEYLKGSELIINQIKSRGICRDCSMEFAIVENEGGLVDVGEEFGAGDFEVGEVEIDFGDIPELTVGRAGGDRAIRPIRIGPDSPSPPAHPGRLAPSSRALSAVFFSSLSEKTV